MDIKILLIEDDFQIFQSIELIVKQEWPKARLIRSYTGREGIDLAKHESPEIILLDLGLPDMCGFEVLKQLRLFSSKPIIVITARSEEQAVVQAMQRDATDFIVKPFRHRELIARIQCHYDRWKTNEIKTLLLAGMTKHSAN